MDWVVEDPLGTGVICVRDISGLCSHWSISYISALSLVESFIVMEYFPQVNTVVDRHSGCGAGLVAALLCCIG